MSKNVLTRIYELRIGKSDSEYVVVCCIEDANWAETDPWTLLPIPPMNKCWQHLRPITVEGRLTLKDANSLVCGFYETDINDDGDKAVDKWTGEKTAIGHFQIRAYNTSPADLAEAAIFNFTNARVRSVGLRLDEIGSEAPWYVSFVADAVEVLISGC